tara:strand:+ start:216 stop:386 length:171 start_codon:yes stop_codon:yes gene_type:complete
MSSFDKFIKDLEKREAEKRAKLEQMRAAEDQRSVRDRVKLYAEKWQNSIRYSRRQK